MQFKQAVVSGRKTRKKRGLDTNDHAALMSMCVDLLINPTTEVSQREGACHYSP
jgi:hypothetical protein